MGDASSVLDASTEDDAASDHDAATDRDAGAGRDAEPGRDASSSADAGADAGSDSGAEPASRLCESCEEPDDCDPGGLCLWYGPGTPLFCGVDCSTRPCPDGFDCEDIIDDWGDLLGQQCAPESESCDSTSPDGGVPPADAGAGDAGSTSPDGGAPRDAGGGNDPFARARELCVELTNQYRSRVSAPSLQRRAQSEPCLDQQSANDFASQTPHGTLGACGERAQNQCEGWGFTPSELIAECLKNMYNEGPGGPHFEQMTSTWFSQVACGFYQSPRGEIWIVQDFFD